MKKCPYCGAEYPDEATICASDETPLVAPAPERKKITGVWRGVYGYGDGRRQVAFTLKLKQGLMEHFTGTVAEDDSDGVPGTGSIVGYFSSRTVEFTKQMPVGYMMQPDGTQITSREYFISQGHKCERELPSAPINYQGTLLDAKRLQGTWTVVPQQIRLDDGAAFSTGTASGFWCAEFVTADLNVSPTGGPAEALFDKSLLSEDEINLVSEVPFKIVGKFSVAEINRFKEEFEQNEIRFELHANEESRQTLSTIPLSAAVFYGNERTLALFVHPDDAALAETIIHSDGKI